MQKMFKPARVGLVFTVVVIMLTVYVSELYRMQIYEVRPAEDDLYPQSTVLRTVLLPAARGNIYDRNGVLLASGRPTYSVTIHRRALMEIPNNMRNDVIRELIFTAMEEGVRYNESFPITMGAPFTYISNISQRQRAQLESYLEYHGIDPDISAPDLLAWLRGHYRIDFTIGIAEARLIIGVRYEIEVRAIVTNLAPYVFANDVDTGFISIIEERSLTGVNIESAYIREYHTSNAAHILGYIGSIPEGQLARYVELEYPMDALVGLVGAELAFEELLRGVGGVRNIRTSDTGTVTDVVTEVEPIPGQHIYLSMDIGLQAAVEDAARSHIEAINLELEDDSEKITGGAVAVIDVQTGEVLAAATYPTFSRATLSQDFMTLLNDPNMPMLNRAMQGQYSPGSTFKMVTALAALRHGTISRYFPINDTGVYEVLYDPEGTYRPSCWAHQSHGFGHGELDVVQAIERSCNYFFCYSADRILNGGESGARAIAEVAGEFGLGRNTGLEIAEVPGIIATPENKYQLYAESPELRGWWRADTVMTSFGQGINEFTPIQLANYAATIANGGKLHSLTLLRRVVSADMSEVVFSHEPVVLNEFAEREYIEIIQEGMLAVAKSRSGTAYSTFGDYPINVAAKTGTVQFDTTEVNNGVFICYAPAENPEIAISIVIEKGGSGSAVMDIARLIFDYYFGTKITAFTVPYGELIP